MKEIFLIITIILCSTASTASADLRAITDNHAVGQTIRATVTAYTDAPEENLGAGKASGTAIGTRIRPGIVAVSRDLLRAGWHFGKKVYIEDLGVFTIEDTMSPRFSKRIDVAVSDMHHAKRIGKRPGKLVVLLHSKKEKEMPRAYISDRTKKSG